MDYVVIAMNGNQRKEIAHKRCMDDALDVIRDMEEFDKAEGFFEPDLYMVAIVKE